MLLQGIRSNASVLAFGLSLAAIYAAALAIVSRLGQLENPALIAGALTLDLTVLVPLLYYLLLVRWRGWPAITVLPVFLGSVLVAGWVIPATQHHVLDLVSYAAAVAELALAAVIIFKAVQLGRRYREQAAIGMDVYEGLRVSAQAVLGTIAGAVVAYECAVFYYAFAGWSKSVESDERSFSVHRNTGYSALIVAVIIALVVETIAVHLLVRLWSPTAAWIFTALSLYALIWLIGDVHAVRLRPLQLFDDSLEIRLGLRWTISVPLASVRAVTSPATETPVNKREYLKAILIGAPNRRIELTAPVCAVGFYGITRRVTTIDLQIDEPDRFDSAVEPASPP
jgi:hypothetical protein